MLYLGRRGQVGKGGRDSIGHLLAAYITDVDRVADRAADLVSTSPGLAPADAGMPSGALLDGESLRNVLTQVMQDDAGRRRVATAAQMLNSDRTAAGVAAWPTEPAHDGATLQEAVRENTTLLGYLSGTTAKGRSGDGAAESNFNDCFDGLNHAEWQVAAALAAAGQLKGMPTEYIDPDGQRHPIPWIVDGQIDLAKLDQADRDGTGQARIAQWWQSGAANGTVDIGGTVDIFVPCLDWDWDSARKYRLGLKGQ